MGKRADRRARRIEKLAAFKEEFRAGLCCDDLDPDEPDIMALKRQIADRIEAVYRKLIKEHPPQEKDLIRQAMSDYVKGLGKGEI